MNALTSKKRRLWPFLFILLGFAIYGQSLTNGFVWDDEEQILNNSAVHSHQGLLQAFGGSSFNSGGASAPAGIYYKPLMVAANTELWMVSGGEPFAFHLFQLSLHIGSAILLAVFLTEFFPVLLAGAAALVFLAHPLNVECVTYVADLQDTLFFFFGILGLTLFAKSTNAASPRIQFSAGLCLLLSVLSKETGLLFFPVMIFFALFFRRNQWKRVLLSAVLVLAIYCILRFGVADLGIRAGNLQPISRASLSERLLSLPKILFFYFSLFFFPHDLAIAQHWVVREMGWSSFFRPLLVDLLFLGGLGALLLRRWDLRATFFSLWFFFGIVLHAQFFPLDLTVADRWFYFTMVGLLGLLALLLEPAGKAGSSGRRIGAALFFIIATVFSIQSSVRSMDWHDGLTLFTHDEKLNPDAFDLENNLGVELFRVGDIQGARAHFEKSVLLAPYWWSNWNNLGVIYERLGDDSRAEEAYRHALSNGVYYLAYENLAKLLMRQHRYSEAKIFLQEHALAQFPQNLQLEKMRELLSGHEDGAVD